MIVCHCHVVNDKAVAAAVGAGARTLSEVCRATGAGRDCGACVFSVRSLRSASSACKRSIKGNNKAS